MSYCNGQYLNDEMIKAIFVNWFKYKRAEEINAVC